MKRKAQPIDPWDSVTFEGARREQLRRWMQLSLREKLQAVEDMGQFAHHFAESRRRRGLPYFDPATQQFVPGNS